MIHDSVGNYVILHHSVLVRSVTCQIGYHGETWALRDCNRRPRAQGKPSDWSPECGRARWGRIVARSEISAGYVNEDGRALRYENGECESPA